MAKSRILLFGIALLLALPLHAGDYPPYSGDLKPGALCDIPIAKLHPTQFNVGRLEIEKRARHIEKMSNDELALYMNAHITPVIIGPGGVPYATDKQHFACAMALAGHTDVDGRVLKNYSDLGAADFWARMKSENLVYLYDKGVGPKDVATLPANMAGLTDDPYRSLAWAVRDHGGYGVDDAVPYADFHWADFFRTRVKIGDGDAGFDKAVDEALELAHSPAAKGLPGYGMKPDKE